MTNDEPVVVVRRSTGAKHVSTSSEDEQQPVTDGLQQHKCISHNQTGDALSALLAEVGASHQRELALADALGRARSEAAELRSQLRQHQATTESVKDAGRAARGALEALASENARLASELSRVHRDLTRAQAALGDAQAAWQAAAAAADIGVAELRAKVCDLRVQVCDLQEQLSAAKAEVSAVRAAALVAGVPAALCPAGAQGSSPQGGPQATRLPRAHTPPSPQPQQTQTQPQANAQPQAQSAQLQPAHPAQAQAQPAEHAPTTQQQPQPQVHGGTTLDAAAAPSAFIAPVATSSALPARTLAPATEGTPKQQGQGSTSNTPTPATSDACLHASSSQGSGQDAGMGVNRGSNTSGAAGPGAPAAGGAAPATGAAKDAAPAAGAEVERLKQAGNTAYRSQQYERALQLYSQALETGVMLAGASGGGDVLPPRLAAVLHCNRAAALHSLGRYIEAVSECDIAEECDPSYLRVLQRRADALVCLGALPHAAGTLRALLARMPPSCAGAAVAGAVGGASTPPLTSTPDPEHISDGGSSGRSSGGSSGSSCESHGGEGPVAHVGSSSSSLSVVHVEAQLAAVEAALAVQQARAGLGPLASRSAAGVGAGARGRACAAAGAGCGECTGQLPLSAASAPALDLYAVLGVPSNAAVGQIRAAYHRLALRLHPDKARSTPTAAAMQAQRTTALGSAPRNSSAPGPADNSSSSGGSSSARAAAAGLFAVVNDAYRTLSGTEARAAYDLSRLMRRLGGGFGHARQAASHSG